MALIPFFVFLSYPFDFKYFGEYSIEKPDLNIFSVLNNKQSFNLAYKKSDLIVSGRIIGKRIIKFQNSRYYSNSINMIEYDVEIIDIYKGKVNDPTLKIITGIGKGDCGYIFKLNNNYIIYCKSKVVGFSVNKYFYTSICSRTTPIYDSIELYLLTNKKFGSFFWKKINLKFKKSNLEKPSYDIICFFMHGMPYLENKRYTLVTNIYI